MRIKVLFAMIALALATAPLVEAQPSTAYVLSTYVAYAVDTDIWRLTGFQVGGTPRDIVINSDRTMAWIANHNQNTVTALNLITNSIVATIPVQQYPTNLALTPDMKRLFVTDANGEEVTVINTATNGQITRFVIGTYPSAMAFTPDGQKLYMAMGYDAVWAINANTYQVIAKITVGQYPSAIAVNSDGSKVFACDFYGNTVAVINTATNTILKVIPVGKWPNAIVFAPDGTKAYVVNYSDSSVSVIDAASLSVSATFPVTTYASAGAVSLDGASLFVTSTSKNQIAEYSTATHQFVNAMNITSPSALAVTNSSFSFHRYRNNTNGLHFYTSSWSELGGGANHWVYEQDACHLKSARDAINGWVPFYRYVKSGTQWHLYTIDQSEVANSPGWIYEGIVGYVYPAGQATHPAGTVALYRYGNTATGDHLYTTDYNELGGGGIGGWVYNGIAGYVLPTVWVSGLTISPASVSQNQSATGTVTLSGPAQVDTIVTLSSDNTAAVTVPASVTLHAGATTATFTASALAVSQTTTPHVTATFNGSQTAPLTVTFTPVLTSVSVAPITASVNANTTRQFTAVAKDQNGNPMPTQPAFTWTVSGGGTITSRGLFTAGGAAGGPFTVTASAGAVSGTASVTVNFVPVLTSISVSPSSTSVNANTTQQFTAVAKDQSGNPMPTQPSFAWSVSGGGAINSNGLFTAGGAAGGPFTVTASSGAISGTASVTVAGIVDLPPTVATPASATPNPVASTTTALSVLGADDGGEAALTYTWVATTIPSGTVSPTFSANGTNAAKNTVATFKKAGSYTFTVTIKEPSNQTVTSSVNVMVNQTLSFITVTPSPVTVMHGANQQFTATAKDLFGNAMTTQPTMTWTATGGTVTSGGLYTAGSTTGSAVAVTAAAGGKSGKATVTVN